MIRTKQFVSLAAYTVCFGIASLASAQTHSAARITRAIDNSHRMTMAGNTRPEATAKNDRGLADDAMQLPAMQLVMARSPEAQKAFDKALDNVTNPASASYHQWLTAAQIGQQFGPSSEDIAKVTGWLTSQGLTVNSVDPTGMVIEFVGTAGAVRSAFNTPIHNLEVDGKAHFANYNDPQFPKAFEGAIAGVASLHNFMPHGQKVSRAAHAQPSGVQGNNGAGGNYLSAADVATIYGFKPIFASGITGKGQTIVLIEDTDQFSLNDWLTFRKVFGLARPYPFATISQVHPAGANTCTAPGANGDDGEAAIDIEWASAAAPNAAIVNAACADTAQFGGFLALQNMLNSSNPPQVVSISYGEAEASLGNTENVFINALYAQGALEGSSIFVSSGDEGAASADANRATATHGIGVSGFTSTPNNISVGGTDTGTTFLGNTATYFSATNGTNFQTALSYIPEVPWNDSCAGVLLTTFEEGPGAVPYGSTGFCNTAAGANFHLTASGSGGPSGCGTGTASTRNVVSGTCVGYPKPSWQSIVGNPADGVRDIPDVSLFAANGLWGVYYAVCWSDPAFAADGAAPCSGDPSTWAGFGGTSISSPIWAGIQALVNQKTGSSWGNSNPVLYALGRSEYGATGSSACNSTLGNAVASSCVFYDVTLGDMDVNCTGTVNCFRPSGTQGVLSVTDSAYQPAYPSTVGWDFATGIGTANATNVVNGWAAAAAAVRRAE
jgi:subtilase family serine protease